jgi:hypothetical protein
MLFVDHDIAKKYGKLKNLWKFSNFFSDDTTGNEFCGLPKAIKCNHSIPNPILKTIEYPLKTLISDQRSWWSDPPWSVGLHGGILLYVSSNEYF